MIHKNVQYGKIKVQCVLEFGKGDILLVNARAEDHVSVLFKSCEANTIGAYDPTTKGTSSDDFKPEVIMVFDNPDSIDVVIDILQKAKAEL